LQTPAFLWRAAVPLVVVTGFIAAWVKRSQDRAVQPEDRSGRSEAHVASAESSPLLAPPPSADSASPARAPAAIAPRGSLDESTLMDRLRAIEHSDPVLAVELARRGNRLFPESADAPERSSILIHALSRQGYASEARGEAEDMVNRYPDSSWVQEVEAFTGAHRHRSVRLNEAGALEFY